MTNANEPQSVTRTVPEGSVVITPTAMYMEIQSLGAEVRHISTLLDPALKDLRDAVKDHEIRIRAAERRIWTATGIASVFASVGGALLSQLYGG